MTKIFLSYSHQDAGGLANFLHERLTGCGYDIWMDNYDLQLGTNFPKAISDALEQSGDFIVLLTRAALQSDWVNDEINMAMAARCRILPIVVDDLKAEEIPLYLRKINFLPMRSKEDWISLDRLVNGLSDGKKIPRVYNLSGHVDITVRGVLVLGHSRFEMANLPTPNSVIEAARKLAEESIPFIKSGSGIVPPGHPVLASAMLAFLLGAVNQMPLLFYTYKSEGIFGISGDNFINLQDLRDEGFVYRSSSS
jgi:hypothetical protein